MRTLPSEFARFIASAVVGAFGLCIPIQTAKSATPIRTAAGNSVPACATPARLNAFLTHHNRQRGYQLRPSFRNISNWYVQHGRHHRVRWDYAFFQMVLETNFLSFRRGDRKPGDVHPSQNNFAGLGATGGGVQGDRYPNVSTGVLAHIQHLVVYSGERLDNPTGHRTRLKQDVILRSVSKIASSRPVTFSDLAQRWAADRRYARSIERIAKLFYTTYCTNATEPASPMAESQAPANRQHHSTPRPPNSDERQHGDAPARTKAAVASVWAKAPAVGAGPTARPRQRSTSQPRTCNVQVASYGGSRAVLIESIENDVVKLTAVNVQPGFEQTMADGFIQAYAPRTGRTIGFFHSREDALTTARKICRQRLANN